MENFEILKEKLEAFIKRFYINELLKGFIFFVAIGLLYFLLTLFIEYLLWLNSTGRAILFWSFVAVEVFLFGRFIVFPLLKLLRIARGIDHHRASLIIGKHFPEVNDKLLNVLQLHENSRQTELLLAGIDQKARELRPVPFSLAVDFRKNLPYLKYAAIPIVIIVLIFLFGRTDIFSSSYERMVHYKTSYEPPAPFQFQLSNEDLIVLENEPLNIQVLTEGNVIPENASIHYEGQSYFMTEVSPGVFRYTFERVEQPFQFYLSANKVVSKPYNVEVKKVPHLLNFGMNLKFPKHTGLGEKEVEGTGNVIVPEGTLISWNLNTRNTERVEMLLPDTTLVFTEEGDDFFISKQFLRSADYRIHTSNREVPEFEKLSYAVKVVRDEYPQLNIEQQRDSLLDAEYFRGQVTDDYGISLIRMVVYPVDSPEEKMNQKISSGKGSVEEFITTFPGTLELDRGKGYEFFFEVFDNDMINGYKSVRSKVFSFRRNTLEEDKQEQLEQQKDAIEGINNSLEKLEDSNRELEELERLPREKDQLNYNDRKRLEDFLKRQKQQNEIMKSYTEKLKQSLEKEESTYKEELKKDLEERLERKEKELQENEELLEELQKYSEKIEEEGLKEKLEKLSKDARSRERSLEQLLELTKRYYVQEKAQKLANELEQLGEEQEKLAEEEREDEAAEQDSLNQKTNETLDQLKELEKENKGLKDPVDLNRDQELEEEIKEDQDRAGDNLRQGDQKKAGQEQKKAGQKMKKLGGQMKQQMQAGEMQQMQEDVSMLRQILDNLITFSFEQEETMEGFKKLGMNANFPAKLRRQNDLRENFSHIDDSLYSLALRNPMITDNIITKISDVDYNLDQSLDRLSQNQVRQGIGSQQYVVTGANDLAYFLSSVLNSMEQMMSAAASGGSGQGMQLPDIIQKQGELNEKMEEGMKKNGKGEGENDGEGEDGQSEEGMGELFKIFQEQQLLRKALQEKLNQEGNEGDGGNLQKEMEQIEKEILEKGFNPATLDRMKKLEHKLLDLEDALKEQGERPERESRTNKEVFQNEATKEIIRAKEFFNTTEILNRQSLPLRQIYRLKVKEYFERGDN